MTDDRMDDRETGLVPFCPRRRPTVEWEESPEILEVIEQVDFERWYANRKVVVR